MGTLIISGGSFDKNFLHNFIKKEKYNYIIAVDRGVCYADELDIIPDLIVGDFDSADSSLLTKYDASTVRTYNPKKDDTDTEIAIREASHRGEAIDIVCATGGRIDHLLGNIHILKIALDEGIEARIVDKNNIIYLKSSDFEIEKKISSGKYISFIPFDGTVKGITLKGFKYALNGYDLKPGITRCISNEITEDRAFVEFESGCLIVVISSDVESE